MATPTPILILDDGELDDIRSLLGELGVDYAPRRPRPHEILEFDPPQHLLIATARRATELGKLEKRWRRAQGAPGDESRATRIAIVSGDSSSLRDTLRALRFDYVVRRPIHPMALRLLVLRAVYRGTEKRRTRRVPIGSPVVYRVGFRRRPALLAELSQSGCRIFSANSLEPGTRLRLQIRSELTGGKRLVLPGSVKRCQLEEPDGSGPEFSIAVVFDPLGARTESRLEALLSSCARQTNVIAPREAEAEPDSARTPSPKRERRGAPRHEYPRKVLAITPGARRVLIGRNLSMSGMLVEPHPSLSRGDKLWISVFGSSREDSVALRALVVRDGGERGLALSFQRPDIETQEKLRELLSHLPVLQRPQDDASDSAGSVVAQILDDDESAVA